MKLIKTFGFICDFRRNISRRVPLTLSWHFMLQKPKLLFCCYLACCVNLHVIQWNLSFWLYSLKVPFFCSPDLLSVAEFNCTYPLWFSSLSVAELSYCFRKQCPLQHVFAVFRTMNWEDYSLRVLLLSESDSPPAWKVRVFWSLPQESLHLIL